jgi:5-methylcytosine-specific restriction endonuclease McrA
MDAAFMGDRTLVKACPDCGVTFHAHHPLCVRCAPCQRIYRNAETCKRDAARRKRQRLAEQASSVLGLTGIDVVRDNGHRCRECRRVLWLNVGKAHHYCHECRRMRDALDVAAEVLAFIAGHAIGSGDACVVCGEIVPVVRCKGSKTCSDECLKERGRQKARDKYESITGVRLRAANGPRPCRFCNRVIVPDHALGRGRDVCDYCNTHRGSFRARAHLYGVPYTHVPRKAIFERDGWRCQLCGRKVKRRSSRSKSTGRLHPRTASLDHIVPLRRGGPHEEANCQCACLECNVRKNARMIGQRRLF